MSKQSFLIIEAILNGSFFLGMVMGIFHMLDSGVVGLLRYMYIILHLLCVSYVTVPAGVRELLECDCTFLPVEHRQGVTGHRANLKPTTSPNHP